MDDAAGYPKVTRGRSVCLKYLHLLAAGLALFCAVAGVSLATHKVHEYERRNVRLLAPVFFSQKIDGSALQRLAFSMPHFLPIYGSSELGSNDLQRRVKTKPGDFFVTQPTGFVAFPVGRGGMTPLVLLQKLAAVGPLAKGHKVVVVLSHNWFTGPLAVDGYEGNATMQHSASLLFGPYSTELKQAAARRLAQFPRTLERSGLLQTENALYAGGATWQLALAKLLTPVGKGWLIILGMMDDLMVVRQMNEPGNHFPLPPPLRRQRVHWRQEFARAERVANVQATWAGQDANNGEPLIASPNNEPPKARKNPSTTEFTTSEVWADYDLLLRLLHESGATVLVLSMPQDGPMQDKNGLNFACRKIYYDRGHNTAAQYVYQARTFEEHDYDDNFLIEHISHLTEKGWLYIDQVIDAFYHNRL